MRNETYGPGGYDPKAPDGNLVEVVEVVDPPPVLSDHEQLVALLAAKELLTLDEAEDLTGKRAELVAEVESWAVAEAVEKR